ncbi:MAG: hypothetical protein EZS28_028760 [Streblomastix strix]|uniref:Protein kinase domain-containing protein n=1 Tax=Streblomastix strix TaxID=222440 RepID=A0A5J4UZR6_9EUKA|nr:MAG: hypothetical protein EZS28_028760 [Streblomastix strix]
MSPEQIMGGSKLKVDSKIDMWAVGIILFQLTTHTFPFETTELPDINQFMFARQLNRPDVLKDDLLWDFLQHLLSFDRNSRFSAEQALKHDFLSGESAIDLISASALKLAQVAIKSQKKGDPNITQYDIDAEFIVVKADIKQIINYEPETELKKIQLQKGWQQLQSQSSSSSQSQLQQLLNHSLPHPYLTQLQQQQIIITIIQEVIFNNESDMENKKNACWILDALYPEGIKLPINLKAQIIKQFCDQSKSDNDEIRENALLSLSCIAVNQDNHEIIVSEGIIEKSSEYIKQKSEGEDIGYSTDHEDEAKQILSAFAYPDKMKEIMKIGRIVQNRTNHDAILDGSFENDIFKYEYKSLNYLQLTYNLLKFGTNANKKKVALAVKEKVERLQINEYVNELINEYTLIKKDQLTSKTQEVIVLIKTIEESIEEEGEFEEINAHNIWNQTKEENNNDNDDEEEFDDEENYFGDDEHDDEQEN